MKVLTTIIFLMFFSCGTVNKLSDDKGINNIFSDSEIVELEKLLSEFDKIVLNTTNSSDIKNSYKKLSELMTYNPEETEWDKIDEELIIFANEKIINLEDKPIFNELWQLSFPIEYNRKDPVQNDTLVKAYPKVFESKYLQLLEHCVNEDKILKDYKESIQKFGDISPTMFYGFPKAIGSLNTKKDCIRLLIAIHFINARNSRHYDDKKYGDLARFPKSNALNFYLEEKKDD